MDINAAVDELTKIGPVLEIPGRPVDLVDDDPTRLLLEEFLEHAPKHWPATLGRRLLLLEPLADVNARALSVSCDGVALLRQRDAMLALTRRRDTYIGKDWFHRSFVCEDV